MVFEAGKSRVAHFTTRVVNATETRLKLVWSSPNTVAGRAARFVVGYKATTVGQSRTGSLTEVAVLSTDSSVANGQNETWVELGALTLGACLDVFITVDAPNASHTVTEDVNLQQVIVDPEDEPS